MPHIHANGDEEQRPRTPEEIAALENEMRIAAQSCWRQGDRRKTAQKYLPFVRDKGKLVYSDERTGRDQRQILSTFERDMLLEIFDENA